MCKTLGKVCGLLWSRIGVLGKGRGTGRGVEGLCFVAGINNGVGGKVKVEEPG